jgi:hypothetical protein
MRKIILLCVAVVLGCGEIENDFDKFCSFVTDLEKKETFTTENMGIKNAIIYGHVISSATYGTEIRESFTSVSTVNPEDKYSLFTEVAEMTLNKNWACPSLQIFFSTTTQQQPNQTPSRTM